MGWMMLLGAIFCVVMSIACIGIEGDNEDQIRENACAEARRRGIPAPYKTKNELDRLEAIRERERIEQEIRQRKSSVAVSKLSVIFMWFWWICAALFFLGCIGCVIYDFNSPFSGSTPAFWESIWIGAKNVFWLVLGIIVILIISKPLYYIAWVCSLFR